MKKYSTRTEYRQKRVQLIRECNNLLLDMLTLKKKDLEQIPLPFFKNLKKEIEEKI